MQLEKVPPVLSLSEARGNFVDSAPALSRRSSRRAGFATRGCVLAASFLVTALALHLLIGDTRQLYAEGRSEKLAQLGAWKHDIDAVAVGSSRIEEGFNPSVFDATLASSQHRSTSFNLGLPGGSETEERFTGQQALRILDPSATKPVRVLIELNAGLNFPPEDVFHPRAINIYDLDTIRFSLGFGGNGIGIVRQLGRSGFSMLSGAANYANAGMVSAMIFRREGSETAVTALASTHGQRITNASAEDRREVEDTVSGNTGPTVLVPALLEPGQYQLLADVAGIAGPASSAHLQLIYVVTPHLYDMRSVEIYPNEMQGPNGPVPIIDVARPDLYPQLYDKANWRNPDHLNAAGAVVFTRLLAQQLNAWLDAHPQLAR
ncbi:MAG: hypothetical protein JO227_13570 [Acetobacteraceae bacterium]|nr:hypothetical protein [Acetobacteraceae bacterium]